MEEQPPVWRVAVEVADSRQGVGEELTFPQSKKSMLLQYVPLAPEPSVLEVELAIEKLKSHKSPGIDQIPAELIKAGGSTIRGVIYKLIIAIWNKEELPGE